MSKELDMNSTCEWTVTVDTCLVSRGIIDVTVNASDETEARKLAVEKVYLMYIKEYDSNDDYIAQLRTRYKRHQWLNKSKIY